MGESGKHHPMPENTKGVFPPHLQVCASKLNANLGCWFYSDSPEDLTKCSEAKSRPRLEKSNEQVLVQGETEYVPFSQQVLRRHVLIKGL